MEEKKEKKGILKEFREFATKGNVMDMAVGVIIATAFGKITASLANDVFMPFIGWIIGDIDLAQLNIVLREAVLEGETVVSEAVVIGIGTFITAIIDFILIAFIVFLLVRTMNKLREKTEARKKKEAEEAAAAEAEAAPPAGPTTEELLTEILTELKKK